MSILFSLRGDTTAAYHSNEGSEPGYFGHLTQTADASALSGGTLSFPGTSNTISALNYNGRGNFPDGSAASFLFRFKTNYSGSTGGVERPLFAVGGTDYFSSMYFYHYNSDINIIFRSLTGVTVLNGTKITTFNNTTTSFYDLFISYTGDSTVAGLKVYLDGSLVKQATTNPSWSGYSANLIDTITMGYRGPNGVWPQYSLDEFVVWDEIKDPTSVTLTSGVGSLNGESRTSLVDVTSFDGLSNTDPGASNVLTGVSYVISGVDYAGTLSAPTPASGSAGTVDLNNIKEKVRYVLEQQNNASGDPVDLSNNMTQRVQQIMKINPDRIPIQASLYPCVTVWIDRKSIEEQTIAKNQLNGKRKATTTVKVAGIVWNANLTDVKEDPADEDLENLMENIELILRAYSDIDSAANWQSPSSADYFSMTIDEETHFRGGVLTLEVVSYY